MYEILMCEVQPRTNPHIDRYRKSEKDMCEVEPRTWAQLVVWGYV